jgi:predicted acyltransferase
MSPEQQPIVIHSPVHGEVNGELPLDDLRPVVTVRDVVGDAAPRVPATGEAATPAPARRANGLDALRGLFLVLMTLGFSLRGLDYPLWMYHRQQPPPDFSVIPVAGLAWRDLAYGAFLFTMAAALPLTLTRRILKGETELGIVFASIKRYWLLLLFALLVAHSNTYFTGYTQVGRVMALAGLVVMALVFTRRRPDWNERHFAIARRAGWVLAPAFLLLSPLLYGSTFSFGRIDDVIAGLAFAALSGSLVWYFTREHTVARLGVLAFAVALYLGARDQGWLQQWWYSSPAPWAFVPSRLGLLAIVIPGTLAGDAVLRWMRDADAPAREKSWSRTRMLLLVALGISFTPLVVVGTYTREVQATTQLCLALAVAGLFLTARPASAVERLLRSLFVWGAAWLLMGLFLEPFQGGIRKVPDTLSYFFTIAGITTMLLVSLTAITDALQKRGWVSALVDVGHNPLLMYVILSVGITSALELVEPLRGVMRSTPWLSFGRSVLETTAAVLLVRVATRRRIYWRT